MARLSMSLQRAIKLAVLAPVLLSKLPFALSYHVVASVDATNFFSMFDFVPSFAYADGIRDYSNGYVNYLNKSDAINTKLATVANGRVRLGVDSSSALDPALSVSDSKYGRNSIRVQSKFTFDAGLLILDFTHMPKDDCGVWSAFWTINNDADESSSGPYYSEVDIAEGVHRQSKNCVTLHTDKREKCEFTSNNGQSGTRGSTSCRLEDGKGYGCEVHGPEGTYGDAVNKLGGGLLALELKSTGIKVWYISRSQIPTDVTSGAPNPDRWPKPMAYYDVTRGNCDIGKLFKKQTTVLNINFCGESGDPTWADGDSYGDDASCKIRTATRSCKEYVAKNPGAFSETYWEVKSVKLYQ